MAYQIKEKNSIWQMVNSKGETILRVPAKDVQSFLYRIISKMVLMNSTSDQDWSNCKKALVLLGSAPYRIPLAHAASKVAETSQKDLQVFFKEFINNDVDRRRANNALMLEKESRRHRHMRTGVVKPDVGGLEEKSTSSKANESAMSFREKLNDLNRILNEIEGQLIFYLKSSVDKSNKTLTEDNLYFVQAAIEKVTTGELHISKADQYLKKLVEKLEGGEDETGMKAKLDEARKLIQSLKPTSPQFNVKFFNLKKGLFPLHESEVSQFRRVSVFNTGIGQYRCKVIPNDSEGDLFGIIQKILYLKQLPMADTFTREGFIKQVRTNYEENTEIKKVMKVIFRLEKVDSLDEWAIAFNEKGIVERSEPSLILHYLLVCANLYNFVFHLYKYNVDERQWVPDQGKVVVPISLVKSAPEESISIYLTQYEAETEHGLEFHIDALLGEPTKEQEKQIDEWEGQERKSSVSPVY